MQEQQSSRDVLEDVFDLLLLEFTLLYYFVQCVWEIFEDEISLVLLDEVVVVCDDVFVLDFLVEFVFAFIFGVFGVGFQDFDGDVSLGEDVFAFEDLTR